MAYREVSLYAIFLCLLWLSGGIGEIKNGCQVRIALKNRIFVSQTGRLGRGPGIFVYI